jgi:hypothetical protein
VPVNLPERQDLVFQKVSLININTVLYQKLTVFFFKTDGFMMRFLILAIVNNRLLIV